MSTTACYKIKTDGNWCSAKPVVVINGKGYCARHAAGADGRAYPPVTTKEDPRGSRAFNR